MRTLVSLLGSLVLLANLACAALCSAPESSAPPCHSQGDSQKATKACDQQSAADFASKLVLPAIGCVRLFDLAGATTVPPSPAAPRSLRHASPPLILRV